MFKFTNYDLQSNDSKRFGMIQKFSYDLKRFWTIRKGFERLEKVLNDSKRFRNTRKVFVWFQKVSIQFENVFNGTINAAVHCRISWKHSWRFRMIQKDFVWFEKGLYDSKRFRFNLRMVFTGTMNAAVHCKISWKHSVRPSLKGKLFPIQKVNMLQLHKKRSTIFAFLQNLQRNAKTHR